jgi:imidazolonepropionase-like amidohydrolase
VIYSLNYPQRPRALAPDARRDARNAAGSGGRTEDAERPREGGVAFAFESAGLSDPKDFVKNAAKAIKAGLAEEAAIRALTLDAATIAGVAERLGSIEKGKIANLIVTDGNLFDERTKITRVFVDGRAVTLEPVAGPSRTRARPRPITQPALVVDFDHGS